MSNTDNPPPTESPKAAAPRKSGCLTAFLVVTGGLLLVPGLLCAIIFGGPSLPRTDLMSRFVIVPFMGVLLVLLVWAIIHESRKR